MKTIQYKEGMKLELLIRDTGGFDGFAVYINGHLSHPPFLDQLIHRFEIPKPTSAEVVVVTFGGNDGGKSAVLDVSGGSPRLLEQAQGTTHGYLIQPA